VYLTSVRSNGTIDVSAMGFKPGDVVEMFRASSGTLYVRVTEEVIPYVDVQVLHGGRAQLALRHGEGTVRGVHDYDARGTAGQDQG
jgi:hypothetical protein